MTTLDETASPMSANAAAANDPRKNEDFDMKTEVRNTRVSIDKGIGKLTNAFYHAFQSVKSASEIAELAEGLGISELPIYRDIMKRRWVEGPRFAGFQSEGR